MGAGAKPGEPGDEGPEASSPVAWSKAARASGDRWRFSTAVAERDRYRSTLPICLASARRRTSTNRASRGRGRGPAGGSHPLPLAAGRHATRVALPPSLTAAAAVGAPRVRDDSSRIGGASTRGDAASATISARSGGAPRPPQPLLERWFIGGQWHLAVAHPRAGLAALRCRRRQRGVRRPTRTARSTSRRHHRPAPPNNARPAYPVWAGSSMSRSELCGWPCRSPLVGPAG